MTTYNRQTDTQTDRQIKFWGIMGFYLVVFEIPVREVIQMKVINGVPTTYLWRKNEYRLADRLLLLKCYDKKRLSYLGVPFKKASTCS